jgi:hypothetical protein
MSHVKPGLVALLSWCSLEDRCLRWRYDDLDFRQWAEQRRLKRPIGQNVHTPRTGRFRRCARAARRTRRPLSVRCPDAWPNCRSTFN